MCGLLKMNAVCVLNVVWLCAVVFIVETVLNDWENKNCKLQKFLSFGRHVLKLRLILISFMWRFTVCFTPRKSSTELRKIGTPSYVNCESKLQA